MKRMLCACWLFILLGSAGLGCIDTAMAADEVRLNIVAFEKRDNTFQFDPIVIGTYSDLLRGIEGHADIVFLNRTPPIRDKDIINLQVDALRLVDNNLANGGLNCQFSFDNESDEGSAFYSVAGLCTLLYVEGKGTRKVRVPIKRVMLSEANYGNNVWLRIYENSQQGIVIYADVDPAK